MKTIKITLTVFFIFIIFNCFSQKFDVDTLLYNGDPNKYINLVIISDGYTSQQLNTLEADAAYIKNVVFSEEPYKSYQSYFNLFLIKVPSNQSGINHPKTASDENSTIPSVPVMTVDNYFKSTFDKNTVHRLVGPPNYNDVIKVLADNVPQYDFVIFIINTPYYGGAGGGGFAAVTRSAYLSSVVIHELGHGLGGLRDEYWPGLSFASEGYNMSYNNDPFTNRWRVWLGISDIGIYQHCCGGGSSGFFKPSQTCVMEKTSTTKHCRVCQEGILERIHDKFPPIENINPPNSNPLDADTLKQITFSAKILQPLLPTVKRIWTINDDTIAHNTDSITIDFTSFNFVRPVYKITLHYIDTSAIFLRNPNHFLDHGFQNTWTVIKKCKSLLLTSFTDTIVCKGQTLKLTNKFPFDKYWSTYDTSSSIFIQANADKVVWVSIKDNLINCVDTINIKVIQYNSLPADTIVCEKTAINITDKLGYSYDYKRIWNNGDTSLTTLFFVDTTTKFWIKIIKNNTTCIDTATIHTYPNTINTEPITGKNKLGPQEKAIYAVPNSSNKFEWKVINADITSINYFNSVEIKARDSGQIYLQVKEKGYYCADSSFLNIDISKLKPESINEINRNISLYPNPSRGKLNLDLTNFDKNCSKAVSIKNILGETVYYSNHSETNFIPLDLTHLSDGVYNITVRAGNTWFNEKLFILK